MKTTLLLIATICFALVLDVFFPSFGGTIIPPLAVVVACYWFWRLTLAKRLLLAFVLGLLLDIIGFLPIGAHTLTLVCMAYVCESMKSFFSNNESRMVIAINVVILMIIFRLLVIPATLLITLSQQFL